MSLYPVVWFKDTIVSVNQDSTWKAEFAMLIVMLTNVPQVKLFAVQTQSASMRLSDSHVTVFPDSL